MKLNLTENQLQHMIECLGQLHMLQWMANKDNLLLEGLLQHIMSAATEQGFDHVVNKVYKEIPK